MGTMTESLTEVPVKKRNLIEMNWDPITRIVGSLGIFTKIDFENKEVAECYSTSSIFRGYSIFMKGKDPRDAHFITSRICGICGDNHATCACYAQNMAFGVRPPALGELIDAHANFTSSIGDVARGVVLLHGQAIVMLGILLLIATPVVRVAISIVLFAVQRDRRFVVITSAVLVLLLISLVTGLGE